MGHFVPALLIGLFATASKAGAVDNSLGTWKLNVKKSTYAPGPLPYRSLIMVRELAEGGVKTTITAEGIDGTRMKISYTGKYDGIPVSVPGTGFPSDTISMKQLDANTFASERQKPGGKYHTQGRFFVSNGGRTMTNILHGTDADGRAMTATVVYERQ